ncbi:unnamed protein product [Musa acuminata subsp. burmannicoides]
MSRFAAGIRILLVLVSTFSLLLIPSEPAVSSIDLGSEWMKVAVVNLKPGQSPISIAINEMSKRKSPALVAFHGGNRLVGEEAAGIVARYPDKVYSFVRDMIGKPYKNAKDLTSSLYLPYDLVEDSRGAAGIRIDDGVTVYTAEELLAMVLSYGIALAESHARVPVKDAVISVPPYFGQAERRGILQAAQLAGINVLSLINEHAGAALQYGIDKDFANESRHVILYDMGSTSTYAALVYFSAYNTKEFGKTVSVNQFQVKDVRWDAKLGGQDLELRLVEYFADEFNKQLGNGFDVRTSPKAMGKLKKQVKRTKEILSANTVAPISVESIYDDLDFRSTISREKFEELCADLWERALVPLKEVLRNSGLKIDDIYAVELIGGATRVPKLQAKLQEFLGRNDLDKHLDADEAIVLGASLHAANLSDGIKLNRRLGMIDGSSYGFVLQLDGPDLLKDENTDVLLIPRMKKMPIKLFRSIKHNKDFEASLSYDKANELPPGVLSSMFAQYSVLGLTETSEKYAARNLSSPIKANLHFSLSRSGVISLDRAEAVIEITEWVEVPRKNTTLENNTTDSFNASTETSPGNTSQGNAESLSSDDDADISPNATNGKQDDDIITEKILKKKTFRVPLKVVEKSSGSGSVLSKDSFSEAKIRLGALDKKDAERRRTAELKNSLEEYIYSTREKIEDNAEVGKVSSEEERSFFVEKLSEVQEWLYTDGEDASASEFKERLESLKAIGDPIFFRLNELTARPLACEHARLYLNDLQKIVNNWEMNKPWLPKAKTEEVPSEAEKLRNWLEEKEEQQKSTPIFESEEVYQKVAKLQDKVASVNRIPKPKPKIEKPPKEEPVSQENSTGTSNNTSGEPTPEAGHTTQDSFDSSHAGTDQERAVHDDGSVGYLLLSSSFSSSSSSPNAPFSPLAFPTRGIRPSSCSLSASAKSLIPKGPVFSEGREEDERRLVCPGCGIFMQDTDPDLPGYYRKKVVAPRKEEENHFGGLSSDSDGFLDEEGEEEEGGIDGLASGSDLEFDMDDLSDGVLMEGAKEGEAVDDGIDWDLDWDIEEDDEEDNLRKELDGFAPAGVGYGNNTEETLEKRKKEKVSKSEKKRRMKEVKRRDTEEDSVTVCARCHSLRNYGQVKNQKADNLIPDFDFDRLVTSRLMKPATSAPVVVMVVDCVDFDGSFPKRAVKSLFKALEGGNRHYKPSKLPKLVLVATKVDLLPSQISPTRLDRWVRNRAKAAGAPKLNAIYLVSARKDLGVKNLISRIKESAGPRGNVWVIGAQNAGKSTLINAFAKREGVKTTRLTEAAVPGTTLGILRIPGILPAKAKMYDTPVLDLHTVVSEKQLLDGDSVADVGQTAHVGSLMRLDLTQASVETIYVTIWASSNVSLHMGKTDNADEIRTKHFGIRLQPPIGQDRVAELGEWRQREMKVSGNSWDVNSIDIAVSGVGWFSLGLKGEATVVLWTFDGIEVTQREPLVLDRAPFLERPGFLLPKAISDAIGKQSRMEAEKEKMREEQTDFLLNASI